MSERDLKRSWIAAARAYERDYLVSKDYLKNPDQQTSKVHKVHDDIVEQMRSVKFDIARLLLRQSKCRVLLGRVRIEEKTWWLSIYYSADGFYTTIDHPPSTFLEATSPIATRVDLCDIVHTLVHILGFTAEDLLQQIYKHVDFIAKRTPKTGLV